MAFQYIEDITQWREDMSFMFKWQEQYPMSESAANESHIVLAMTM